MSLLDIDNLINEEICPSQSILMQWLGDNLVDSYIDKNFSYGKNHSNAIALNLPFTIIKDSDGWWSFKLKYQGVFYWNYVGHTNQIYVKKGTDIPYFIKKASKSFEIKFV